MSGMFDWVVDALSAIKEFFINLVTSIIDWFVSLPAAIIEFLLNLWLWIREETLLGCTKLLYSSFESLLELAPFPLNVDWDSLAFAYHNVNFYLPLDDAITLAIFLFNTWLFIRMARYSTILALFFFKPSKILKPVA